MCKKEAPVFKNDLSAEEQEKQNIAFLKEENEKQKSQKMIDIIDGIATLIDIIS